MTNWTTYEQNGVPRTPQTTTKKPAPTKRFLSAGKGEGRGGATRRWLQGFRRGGGRR